MSDDPTAITDRLLEFYEALRRATAPPPSQPNEREMAKGGDIRMRRAPPPSTPEEALAVASANLTDVERVELARLIDKLTEGIPKRTRPG